MNVPVNFFGDLKLKWKFTVISVAITFSVMTVSAALFITANYFNTRSQLVDDAMMEADILGQNCVAALIFGDVGGAEKILKAAKSHAGILRVVLTDASGDTFAEYRRVGGSASKTMPEPLLQGVRYGGNSLNLTRPIVVNQESVGSIYFERSLVEFHHRELLMLGVLLAIVLLSLPISFWLSLRLQGFLTGPIHDLVDAANRVSESRDYSVRVSSGGKDELGALNRVFNEMIGNIEERETRLRRHVAEQEAKVASRTAALQLAKEQAESATKLKDNFLSLVSHDLKGPLGAIRGMAGISMEGELSSGENRDFAKHIFDASNGLLGMIGKLLDISRLQTGAIRPDKTCFDVNSVSQEAVRKVFHLAEIKDIHLINESDPQALLFADRILTGEVILNLLTNAIKFTPRGGSITVYNPNPRTVAVRDTGGGIPPTLLPNIFRHDVKTVGYGTSGEIGTGLGLPFCHDIITAHGGILRVETGAGGSSFYAEFPCEKPIVMLVDDQEIHRIMMRELIEKHYPVDFMEANNGVEALARLENCRPVIVISDINMPEMDGFELLAELRKSATRDELPIILSTALAATGESAENTVDNKLRANELGANDFILKPIVPDDFIACVKRYL